MKIAIDAVGSDDRPGPDVEGAVAAAREFGHTIVLVGPQATVSTELAKHNTAGLDLHIVDAPDVIAMTDKPAEVVRQKPNSSMHVGMMLVKEGEADAFVTAGNTGAALAIGTLRTLRRIDGVARPALAAIFRNLTGHTTLCDFGANTDSKPEYLVQYAIMAEIWARLALGLERPRVGLLANGEEEGKGDQLVKDTLPLLRAVGHLNVVGNVEPKQVLRGEADVVVADGFVGNIMGKSLEAMGSYMGTIIREELTASPVTAVGGLLARPALKRVRGRLDPEEIGGVPLLGLNGTVIVAHGSSSARAIRSAIMQAARAVEVDVVGAIATAFAAEAVAQ